MWCSDAGRASFQGNVEPGEGIAAGVEPRVRRRQKKPRRRKGKAAGARPQLPATIAHEGVAAAIAKTPRGSAALRQQLSVELEAAAAVAMAQLPLAAPTAGGWGSGDGANSHSAEENELEDVIDLEDPGGLRVRYMERTEGWSAIGDVGGRRGMGGGGGVRMEGGQGLEREPHHSGIAPMGGGVDDLERGVAGGVEATTDMSVPAVENGEPQHVQAADQLENGRAMGHGRRSGSLLEAAVRGQCQPGGDVGDGGAAAEAEGSVTVAAAPGARGRRASAEVTASGGELLGTGLHGGLDGCTGEGDAEGHGDRIPGRGDAPTPVHGSTDEDDSARGDGAMNSAAGQAEARDVTDDVVASDSGGSTKSNGTPGSGEGAPGGGGLQAQAGAGGAAWHRRRGSSRGEPGSAADSGEVATTTADGGGAESEGVGGIPRSSGGGAELWGGCVSAVAESGRIDPGALARAVAQEAAVATGARV